MAKNKKIAMGSVAAAFIFLFNPTFAIIDLLPDFIGYLLLAHGLMKFADLNDSIMESTALIRKMALVDIAKIGAIMWVFRIPSSQEQASNMLLMMFVFCGLELLLMLPAYKKLFDGLGQLGDFHPNTAIHGKKGSLFWNDNRSYTDKILRATIKFLILKNILSFLPELTELTSSIYADYRSSPTVNLYYYIGLLRGFSFVLVLIIGIVWLVKIECYVHRVSKDKTFLNSVWQCYAERVLPKVGLFATRSLNAAFFALFGAVLLLSDFYIDGVNVLPDSCAAIFFLAYFICVQKLVPVKRVTSWISSILFLVFAIASDAFDYRFQTYHFYSSRLKGEDLRFFLIRSGIQVLSLFLFLWVMANVMDSFFAIVRMHTGIAVGTDPNSEGNQIIASVQQKELKRSMIPLAVGVLLYIVFTAILIFQPAISAYFSEKLGFINMLQLLSVLIFFLTVFRFREKLSNCVKAKYLLE